MRSDFLDRLQSEVLVFSGAVATALQPMGLDLGQSVARWQVEHPDAVQGLLRAYYEAGADIGLVDTSSSNRLILQKYGLADKTREYVSTLLRLGREITPPDRYLPGTMMATGHLLHPLGDVTFAELYDAFSEQAIAAAEVGVDLFWIMTMSDIEEAKAAIRAVKDHTGLPVVATMVFNPTPKGYRTMMGLDPATAARKLREAGADVVGANCGNASLKETTEIVKQTKQACECYVAAKPNAGMPELVDDKPVWTVTPEDFAREVPNWLAAGANIVSGCCGTGPEHIVGIAAAVKKRGKGA